MSNCNLCNNELTGKYCSNCGHPAIVERINSHYIIHEIEHVLHFEKGILFTVKELLIRPGDNIHGFIVRDRSKLVKPIVFIIVSSLIYTIVTHFFHIEDGYINFSGGEKSAVGSIINWVKSHYGYANIIIGVFIAFWLKVFFKKYDYNFFEILILLCFIIGMTMLIFSLFALVQGLTKLGVMEISAFIGIVYCSWAIGQFFDKNKVINYLKAFIAYSLGLITFVMSAILLGLLVDLIIKH